MLNIKLCGFFRIILYCRDVQRLSYQRFMTKNKFPHLFSAKIKSSACGVFFYLRFPINEWTCFVIGYPAENRRKKSMAIYMLARECLQTDRERTHTEHNTVQSATWDIGCIQGWFSIVCEVESSQERQVENGSKMRDECVVIMFVCSS